MKVLAFDLEIAKIIPPGEEWRDYRPLGISCAAAYGPGMDKLWWGEGPKGEYLPQMPQDQVQDIILWLGHMVAEENYEIITWNGLGFDFSVLAEESGMFCTARNLALRHYDVMWHFFAENGWAIGLNAAAAAIRMSKTEGMDGAQAPIRWAKGEYAEVLAYCRQDVWVTWEVFEAFCQSGCLPWVSRSGAIQVWYPSSGRPLTAREALALPEPPPPSWIQNPWPRSQFTGWMRLEELDG